MCFCLHLFHSCPYTQNTTATGHFKLICVFQICRQMKQMVVDQARNELGVASKRRSLNRYFEVPMTLGILERDSDQRSAAQMPLRRCL